MRITIDEITGDGSVVRFSYESGHADGVWQGDGRPTLGPVDVEWAIPGRFWWDDDVRISTRSGLRLVRDPDTFSVLGVAVGLDQVGALSLRIGDGTIVLDTAGKPPVKVIGAVVEVDSPLIELFPIQR